MLRFKHVPTQICMEMSTRFLDVYRVEWSSASGAYVFTLKVQHCTRGKSVHQFKDLLSAFECSKIKAQYNIFVVIIK